MTARRALGGASRGAGQVLLWAGLVKGGLVAGAAMAAGMQHLSLIGG